jgi:hypothetical protein
MHAWWLYFLFLCRVEGKKKKDDRGKGVVKTKKPNKNELADLLSDCAVDTKKKKKDKAKK